MGKKWQWIGHTLRKPLGATERNALNRNPQGTRKGWDQEQPGKNNRKGTAEGWKKVERDLGLALYRTKWKGFMTVQCST